MQYIKVNTADAEIIKRKILRNDLFDKQREIKHSLSYVYFPIQNISKAKTKKLISGTSAELFEEKSSKTTDKPLNYREGIKKILTAKEYAAATKSYDILGNIATIDLEDELRKKEKRIAEVIMQVHPSVETVLAKAGAVSGKYRTRKFRIVAGKRSYIALYKENNCTFKFDVRKTYFSNRLSFERIRICNLVKDGENVMVLFAGIGPFAIEIAKMHKKTKVMAIEHNKYAFTSMLENIRINKTTNVKAVLGDVRKTSAWNRNFADRIIVPMPTASTEFLDDIYKIAKKKAVVHLYNFGKSDSAFEDTIKKIREHGKENKYDVRIISKRVARPYSSKEIEVVIDYLMAKKR